MIDLTGKTHLGARVFAHQDGEAIVLTSEKTGCCVRLDPDVWNALIVYRLRQYPNDVEAKAIADALEKHP